MELERGGALVLALGFFSMSLCEGGLRPSSRERAAELSSIKRDKKRKKRVVIRGAGQATKALAHVCQTRRLHYGDILTTKQTEKKNYKRHQIQNVSQRRLRKVARKKSGGLTPEKVLFPLLWELPRPAERFPLPSCGKTDKLMAV